MSSIDVLINESKKAHTVTLSLKLQKIRTPYHVHLSHYAFLVANALTFPDS